MGDAYRAAMLAGRRVKANPSIVFRVESDQWALLYEPDTGLCLGLNPVSTLVWRRLDGRHTLEEIVSEVSDHFDNVPDDVSDHIEWFVQDLLNRGLASYERHETR